MTDPPEGRAFKLADMLGATQEARRLGHRLIGTEHVLMAAFADPVVRWALRRIGCDMRSVQELVTREGSARQDPGYSERGAMALTSGAADLVTRATVAFPGLDPDQRIDPRLMSSLHGAVMTTLLGDEQDGAAVRILDEMEVRQHAQSLAVAIQQNAGPAVLPRPE